LGGSEHVGLVDLRTEAPRLLGVIGGLWLAHVDPPALPEVRASVGRMTAAGDAGRLVESVRAEHVERPAGWIGGTYEMHARCELDGCRWPCGAVQVAEALEKESARAERLAGVVDRLLVVAGETPTGGPDAPWIGCGTCHMGCIRRADGRPVPDKPGYAHKSWCPVPGASAALGLATAKGGRDE
jgi:hypothetical protein